MPIINENSEELNDTFTKRVEREEVKVKDSKKEKTKKLISDSSKSFVENKDEFKHRYVSSAILPQANTTMGATTTYTEHTTASMISFQDTPIMDVSQLDRFLADSDSDLDNGLDSDLSSSEEHKEGESPIDLEIKNVNTKMGIRTEKSTWNLIKKSVSKNKRRYV